MTYNIVADFTMRRYHSSDLAQWYRCAAVSVTWHNDIAVLQYQWVGTMISLCCSIVILKVISYTCVQSVGRITWRWAVTTAAAVQEEERRDWHGLFPGRLRWLTGLGGVKFCDDIMISSLKFTRYRDTKNSHDSSHTRLVVAWKVCYNS